MTGYEDGEPVAGYDGGPFPASRLAELDPAKVGETLIRMALISRQLRHSDVRETIRDYLAPHYASETTDPERGFVFNTFLFDAADYVPEEDMVAFVQAVFSKERGAA